MAKKSSTKGFSYEREQARQWSLWWSNDSRDDLFWRTSGSGSRATNKMLRGGELTRYQHGDMTFVDPAGKPLLDRYCFEFKRYHQIDCFSVLYETCPDKSLLAMWAKAVKEAAASDRIPLLVTRVDKGKSVVWLPDGEAHFLSTGGLHVDPAIQFLCRAGPVTICRARKVKVKGKKRKKHIPAEVYWLNSGWVLGMQLDQFFKTLSSGWLAIRTLTASVWTGRNLGHEIAEGDAEGDKDERH